MTFERFTAICTCNCVRMAVFVFRGFYVGEDEDKLFYNVIEYFKICNNIKKSRADK